jgi:AcrR family transcriptional regulator
MSDARAKATRTRSASDGAAPAQAVTAPDDELDDVADWQRRVVGRSLRTATKRSIDRGATLIRAAATLLERSNGDGFTVQEVANEAGQSLRTLYQYFESKDDLLLAVFEEAMKRYARMIRNSIAGLDDPLERLAGAVIAAASMPAYSSPGVDVGLARLRLKLGDVDPALVARSHEPVTLVFLELVHQAAAAGEILDQEAQPAVYIITSLNSSFIISQTLGNDQGLDLPEPEALARFCLQGLGAELKDGWYASISGRLLPPVNPDDDDWPSARAHTT